MGQAKRKREELIELVRFGDMDKLFEAAGPDVAGFYLRMRTYIYRGPGAAGNEVIYSVRFLAKKIHCSLDRFYRLLRLCVDLGLITIKKVRGFEGRNRNVYVINPVPATVFRSSEYGKPEAKKKTNGVKLINNDDILVKLSTKRAALNSFREELKNGSPTNHFGSSKTYRDTR
jgi:hypothetical protein